MLFLHVYIQTTCVPGAHGGQEEAEIPWELQVLMSHHIGPGNITWVLCKRCKYSSLPSHFSSPTQYPTSNGLFHPWRLSNSSDSNWKILQFSSTSIHLQYGADLKIASTQTSALCPKPPVILITQLVINQGFTWSLPRVQEFVKWLRNSRRHFAHNLWFT